MDGTHGVAPPAQKRERPAAVATDRELAALCLAGAVTYAAFALGAPGLPGAIMVGVPFLLLPLAAIAVLRKPFDLGRFDAGFALSIASYAPFAAVAAAAAWSQPVFYRGLAGQVAAPSIAIVWAVDTYLHVGAVDFFTKRVVQSEGEARYGARTGLWLQVVVWGAAHILEWTWLRFIFGDLGAAAYLGSAGVVTGFAYARWRNVLGLMTGHFIVNVAAAGAALALYG